MGSGVFSILFSSVFGHSHCPGKYSLNLLWSFPSGICLIDVLQLSNSCVVSPNQFNC